jgi:hypothetical protein
MQDAAVVHAVNPRVEGIGSASVTGEADDCFASGTLSGQWGE